MAESWARSDHRLGRCAVSDKLLIELEIVHCRDPQGADEGLKRGLDNMMVPKACVV